MFVFLNYFSVSLSASLIPSIKIRRHSKGEIQMCKEFMFQLSELVVK